jgi:trigger factor
MDEAIDLLVHDMYPKVLDEAEIKPYGPGSLTNITQIDPPVLEFQVPLEPTVKLGDYKAVRVPYELKPTEEQEVEDMLTNLRERYATYTKVERPAQEGDQVVVHLSSERAKPEEGQSVILIRDRETSVTIDPEEKDTNGEWPFPGFSRQLIGLSAGDEKTIEYTYAEDSVLESLRGTEAIFRVQVDAVNLPGMPVLDDEFAKTLGEESLETLRTEIRKSIEERAKSEYDSDYHDKLMAELLKDAEIKYPPQMLEHEIDGMIEQLKNRMQQQGVDYPTYLKTRQLDDVGFREEIQPNAVERLHR